MRLAGRLAVQGDGLQQEIVDYRADDGVDDVPPGLRNTAIIV
jgi:hypothetical protein